MSDITLHLCGGGDPHNNAVVCFIEDLLDRAVDHAVSGGTGVAK